MPCALCGWEGPAFTYSAWGGPGRVAERKGGWGPSLPAEAEKQSIIATASVSRDGGWVMGDGSGFAHPVSVFVCTLCGKKVVCDAGSVAHSGK